MAETARDGDLLTLDVGTSATKAAVIDRSGRILAAAASEHPTRTVAAGGVEQDPSDWIRSARAAIASCLRAEGSAPPRRITALGLTGQMQDLILLGPERPGTTADTLGRAVLYSDTRAAEDAVALHAALPAWDEIAGTVQDATSCAAMWRRVRRLDPVRAGATRRIVFGPAGYLAHALGLGAWCDATTASATGLLEGGTGEWSAEICAAAGLDPALLPALTDSTPGGLIGLTGASAGGLLGLPAGIPVVLAPGDAAASTLGIVGLEPGDGYAYLGTSGWLARVRPRTSVHALPDEGAAAAHRLALPSPQAGVLEIAALLSAGASAAWGREAFLAGASPGEADRLLDEREQRRGRGPSGLLALPSIHGERFPVRDDRLRAAVIGMGADTRGIDIYAAVLEGVAQALAHAEAALAASDDGTTDPVPRERPPLAVSGGGSTSLPWMRILADVLGRPLRIVDDTDATLVGCALATAEALGREHSMVPLAHRDLARTVDPDPCAAASYAEDRTAHRALYGALAGLGAS